MLAAGWLEAQPRGPVQNFRPWPGSHGPQSQTPPPSQVSSRVWPSLEVTWMLSARASSHAPPRPGPLS